MTVEIRFFGDYAADVIQDLCRVAAMHMQSDTTDVQVTELCEIVAKMKAAAAATDAPVEMKVETGEPKDGEALPPASKPRGRPPKKAPMTIEATANPPEPEAQQPAEQKAETPNIDAVRAALIALAKAKGEDAAFTLLGEFGAKSASSVPEYARAKLIEKAKTAEEAS